MNCSDLIIIGSGPGGYRAADYAAKHGLRVTVFESSEAGGTCLNCGCIPTKALCHAATLAEKDFAQAANHKDTVVEQLRSGVEQLLAQPGITLVRGRAAFKDNNTVVCDGTEYNAKNIIIATGSKPKMPPIDGITLPHVLTSTEMLSLKAVPERLAIIGAGVIGMEFASVMNAFGCKVTVIEFLKECLPAIDGDIAKRLRKAMERKGVEFIMQAAVKRITPEAIVYERKGKEATVETSCVLVATGRTAMTDGLQLGNTDVKVEPQGIVTNEMMQTSVPNIYAIGDVNGRSLLAHAATMQGIRAVNHILQRTDSIRFDIMPAAVFTSPEVASVGLTEEQCKQQHPSYQCRKALYRANGKALAMNEDEGILKLLAAEDGTILGCHVMGAHAADLVQEVAALMNFNATVQRLRDITHIHPTLGEILQSAAEMF